MYVRKKRAKCVMHWGLPLSLKKAKSFYERFSEWNCQKDINRHIVLAPSYTGVTGKTDERGLRKVGNSNKILSILCQQELRGPMNQEMRSIPYMYIDPNRIPMILGAGNLSASVRVRMTYKEATRLKLILTIWIIFAWWCFAPVNNIPPFF